MNQSSLFYYCVDIEYQIGYLSQYQLIILLQEEHRHTICRLFSF